MNNRQMNKIKILEYNNKIPLVKPNYILLILIIFI